MKLSVYDKDAKKIITSKDPESSNITITLDGRIFWGEIDMSNDLELIID